MPRKGENDNRDYQKENREYKSKPDQIAKRVARNKARREAIRDGRVSKGDGKEIDHVKPLRSGGSNAKSNTRVVDAEKNHGWRKGKKGEIR
jgi:hypothetical protein